MGNCVLGSLPWTGDASVCERRATSAFPILSKVSLGSKFLTRSQYNLQWHRLFHPYTSESKAESLQLGFASVIHIFIPVTEPFHQQVAISLLSSFP